MSESNKEYLKNNFISFSSIVIVLSFIATSSKWQQKIESHVENEILHMPFKEKINVFVPRVEIDVRLKNIENYLRDINLKIAKDE